ncbi:hypothetical protein JCM8097_001879 [Rhodosporidiobolus ruineniae]
MGLFSRKKARDPLPSPSTPHGDGRSTSAPAAVTLNTVSHDAPLPSLPSPTESTTSSSWARAPKPRRPSASSASPRFPNPFRTASTPVSPQAPHPARGGNGSQESWDDAGIPLGGKGGGAGGATVDSPNLVPLDRYKVFGGRASSSTVSLPLLSSSRDDPTPRMRQTSAMQPVQERDQQEQHRDDKGMFSRFRKGFTKPRQGSVSSFRGVDGAGLGTGGADEDSGFVVKSFRTVSRVHEDPVMRGAYAASPPATVPLPTLPNSAPPFEQVDQQESLRSSIDYSTAPSSRPGYPRRPSLNTITGSPTQQPWERAPSPTITADAFRLASARSKSSLSLVSLQRDANDLSSSVSDIGVSSSRPRFEPVQRPSSRTSRRNSGFSDLGIASSPPSTSSMVLHPPRPSFAVHSNGSSSLMHSRASSSGSISSYMLGANGLPQPAGSPSSTPLAVSPSQQQSSQRYDFGASNRAGVGLANSESFTSWKTAPESAASRTATPSRVATPAQAPKAEEKRPEMAKRMSSGDSELRLIAQYGESITSSPPCASPTDLYPSPSQSLPSLGRPPSERLSAPPAVAVQPPTPQSKPGFSSSAVSSSSTTTTARPKRTSSLAPEAVKSALQGMGVGPGVAAGVRSSVLSTVSPTAAAKKGKSRAFATGTWADSSDEERLSTSDEGGEGDDSSDDDVPLAQIKSRSQTDLGATLRAGGSEKREEERPRRPSLMAGAGMAGEVEVLADRAASPASSGFALATAATSGNGAALNRRGSNRRSMSTFSLATTSALAASAPPSAAPLAAPAGGATRSILSRPSYQPRSISNPSSPSMPYFASPQITPASSNAATPALSPVPSPTFPSNLDRSSASSASGSASGTGSSSSAPLTPHDTSPARSELGLGRPQLGAKSSASSLGVGGLKPSVKFDPVSLASNSEAHRVNKGRRASAISSSNNSVFGQPLQPPHHAPQHHRSTPSLPTFASVRNLPPSATASQLGGPPRPSFLGPSGGRGGSSSLGTTPTGSRAPSTVTAGTSTPGTSASVHDAAGPGSGEVGEKGVYDRMKARHRAEALQALKIGRDLNHPSGMVPEDDEGADEEDDEQPLASLPTKSGAPAGSMLAGMTGGGGGGSVLGGTGGMPLGVGMGGAFSPLAVAPPGVDPFLYASLPPDQKMSLHQRSQQMMAMMQQAAVQAHAESVIGGGSAIGGQGGDGGSMLGGQPGGRPMSAFDGMGGYGGMGHHQHSPSMQFGAMGHLGGGGGYGAFPAQAAHLPPFAPPYAMSQPFFQHPQQQMGMLHHPQHQSMYGMPGYAGSAIGFGGGGGAPASIMGVPTGPGGGGGRGGQRAASTIGMPQRR